MAAWYFDSQPDELLLDFDEFDKPTRRGGGPWCEEFFRLRLQAAMEAGKLDVRDVWIVASATSRHKHVIVRLSTPMFQFERLTWQIHLGSDLYRARADYMRAGRGIIPASLLIEKTPIVDPVTGEPFWRRPDAECSCVEKHVTEDQFKLGDKACPVWRKYRGMSPWELWGPSPKPQQRVKLKDGHIPLDYIRAQIPKINGRQPQDPEIRKAWAMSRQMASRRR